MYFARRKRRCLQDETIAIFCMFSYIFSVSFRIATNSAQILKASSPMPALKGPHSLLLLVSSVPPLPLSLPSHWQGWVFAFVRVLA